MSFGGDPSLSGSLTASAVCVACMSTAAGATDKDQEYGTSRIAARDGAGVAVAGGRAAPGGPGGAAVGKSDDKCKKCDSKPGGNSPPGRPSPGGPPGGELPPRPPDDIVDVGDGYWGVPRPQ